MDSCARKQTHRIISALLGFPEIVDNSVDNSGDNFVDRKLSPSYPHSYPHVIHTHKTNKSFEFRGLGKLSTYPQRLTHVAKTSRSNKVRHFVDKSTELAQMRSNQRTAMDLGTQVLRVIHTNVLKTCG